MLGIRNKYWSAGLQTDEFHPTLIFGTWIVCETVVARQLPCPQERFAKKKKMKKINKNLFVSSLSSVCTFRRRLCRGPRAHWVLPHHNARIASTEPISELSRECLLCHSLSRANTRDCDRLCTRKLKRQALHPGSISVGGSRETCIFPRSGCNCEQSSATEGLSASKQRLVDIRKPRRSRSSQWECQRAYTSAA